MSIVLSAISAFGAGFVIETCTTLWADSVQRRSAARAAALSLVCALCQVLWIGELVEHGRWVSLAYVAGVTSAAYLAVSAVARRAGRARS